MLYEIDVYFEGDGWIGLYSSKYIKTKTKIKNTKTRIVKGKGYRLFRFINEYNENEKINN
jgi:hypothetical protein